jgi:hypothetical protein
LTLFDRGEGLDWIALPVVETNLYHLRGKGQMDYFRAAIRAAAGNFLLRGQKKVLNSTIKRN